MSEVRRHTVSIPATIKVGDEFRERLKAQASRDGLTLGAGARTNSDDPASR